MTVAFLCLTAILIVDTLFRWRRKRGARPAASTGHDVDSSRAYAIRPVAKIWRGLVAVRVIFELICWAVLIGYVVLLIWTIAIGPIRPIHEWFMH